MPSPPSEPRRPRRIVAVNGSASPLGRCHGLAQAAVDAGGDGWVIDLADFGADALLGRNPDGYLSGAIAAVAEAEWVVLVSPERRGTYSTTVHAFLDLLPDDALRDKRVLLGGTTSDRFQFASLDEALRSAAEALGGTVDDESVYGMAEDFAGDGRPGPELMRTFQRTLRLGTTQD